ncbi:hypothetical protein ACOSP7_008033 [Xanthoceras sorbifolium]
MGTIILPVTLGQPPAQIKWLTEFLVVNTPSAYNIILGRHFLVKTKSVLSIYHHVLKLPVRDRVGVVHEDQHLTGKCYAVSTNPTALLKHCVRGAFRSPGRRRKEKRIPRKQGRATLVDDLEVVSIKDDDPSKKVRVCAKLYLSKDSFWRRTTISKSSSYTSSSHTKHFRIRERSSEVCNHHSGLFHTIGRSQVFGVNHRSINHQFPSTIDCIHVWSSKSNHHGFENAIRQ